MNRMNIVELHNKAMELADEADLQSRMGNLKEAKDLYSEAYVFEQRASAVAVCEHVGEPSETVLIKSVAFLAFDAKLFDESEKMAKWALSRNLPKGMVEEMKELLKNIRAARLLRVKIPFNNNEILIRLAGRGETQKKARKDDIEDRVKIITRMIARTAELQKNIPYRQSGQPSKDIKEICAYNHSIERKTNHAVMVRLDQIGTASITPEKQVQVSEILDNIATNLSLVNQGNLPVLYERIQDPSYFKNFLILAKEFAPDGNKVEYVKFTYINDGKKDPVRLTRQKRDYNDFIREAQSWSEVVK